LGIAIDFDHRLWLDLMPFLGLYIEIIEDLVTLLIVLEQKEVA